MKKIIIVIGIVAVLAAALYKLAVDTEAGQNFLLDRALSARMSQSPVAEFSGLEVMVCGSSSPLPDPDRAQACIMVRAGDRVFLVDAGSGSNKVLRAERIPMQLIGTILLTHFHSDHISAIGDINLNSWVAGRPARLQIVGPEGVESVVAGFNMAYALDRSYRTAHHGEELMPAALGALEARTIVPGVVYSQDGLIITAFEVDHAPIRPAVGYRFDYMGRSVVVTGDTVVTKGIEVAAKDADLLLTDALSHDLISAMSRGAAAGGQDRQSTILEDVMDYHADSRNIGKMAAAAGVGQVALYHLVPPTRNVLMENIFMRGVPDDVILTHDGLRFFLPAGSDELKIVEKN